jgi:hypothetical protein
VRAGTLKPAAGPVAEIPAKDQTDKMKKLLGLSVLMVAALPAAENKVRVFIEKSDSWEQRGGGLFGGSTGGARNQTPELIKTFNQKCGDAVTITVNKEKADFTVTFSHEGGKGWAMKDNKIAVFDREGDMVHSDSARSLGGAVEGACRAIAK